MKLKITVHGVAYEVDVEVLDASDEMGGAAAPLPASAPPVVAAAAPAPAAAPLAAGAVQSPVGGGTVDGVASPIAGTVLEVKVKPGDAVNQDQVLLVIEAMKMETAIAAPRSGTVKTVLVAAGDSVRETQTLIEFA